MSQAVHLVAKNLPVYGTSEGKCLPCLGVSGRAVAVSSCSSHGDFRIRSKVKIGAIKCVSIGASFMCRASSGGYRRNPDFLKQNKIGFRSRNRQNEEKDSLDDEADLLSSKNGPLVSLSNSPKFQATAVPGPREKEIVELFRKVQAQLRERAGAKEDKKIEAMQEQHKESETLNSLLKLLRKHSVEQGKRKSTGGSSSKDFNLDQTELNGSNDEDKSTNVFDSTSRARAEAREPNAPTFTRPASNFRRRSPVTQFKHQPVYSSEEMVNSVSHFNSSWKSKNSSPDVCIDPKHDPEPEPEPEQEPEASFADGDVYDEVLDIESNLVDSHVYDEVSDRESYVLEDSVYGVSEGETSDIDDGNNDEDGNKQEQTENEDLSSLKLLELRALAKSRGVKGFSKMKKVELVKLLTSVSV